MLHIRTSPFAGYARSYFFSSLLGTGRSDRDGIQQIKRNAFLRRALYRFLGRAQIQSLKQDLDAKGNEGLAPAKRGKKWSNPQHSRNTDGVPKN